MTDNQNNSNPFPETVDDDNGYQYQNTNEPTQQNPEPQQQVPSQSITTQPTEQQHEPQTVQQTETQSSTETQPNQNSQQPENQTPKNTDDKSDWKEKTDNALTKTESGMDVAFEKTDEAVGKSIVGFSEKVGAAFRKWFKLA